MSVISIEGGDVGLFMNRLCCSIFLPVYVVYPSKGSVLNFLECFKIGVGCE